MRSRWDLALQSVLIRPSLDPRSTDWMAIPWPGTRQSPMHVAILTFEGVHRACNMILRGGGLAETAAAVGFTDQAHVPRAFRRTLGYTPGDLQCPEFEQGRIREQQFRSN